MLILSRKPGESIVIGNSVRVRVLSAAGGQVRLGVEAAADVPVLREELLEEEFRPPAAAGWRRRED